MEGCSASEAEASSTKGSPRGFILHYQRSSSCDSWGYSGIFTGMWQTVVFPLVEGNISERSSDKVIFFPELIDIQKQLSVTGKVRSQHNHYLQVTFSLEALHRLQSYLQGFGFPAACTLRQACSPACGVDLACGHTWTAWGLHTLQQLQNNHTCF